MLRYETDLGFSELFLTVNFDGNLVHFFIFKHNTVDIGGRSNRGTQFPFTMLVILVFVGFGIFFHSELHGRKHFALPPAACLLLFSDENPFNFPHPECPERTPLFTESHKSPTVSCRGQQLHPCVTI